MRRFLVRALLLLATAAIAVPATAAGDQVPQTPSAPSRIAAGKYHSCAVIAGGSVRCWGYGANGQLGYANRSSVGDDETPASAGPVNLGAGRTATAVSAGSVHTCAILDDGTVRCWGYGGDGRLGYVNTNSVGVTQAPGAVGPVDLGTGRTAVAISAGGAHTCVVLDDGTVRCWGFGFDGQLGYGNTDSVGDNETPASAGPVNLGAGHTARAISAGVAHTCATLDDGTVRCWGFGGYGQLGYATTTNVGDSPATTPDKLGAVDLGAGRTAVAISAGDFHTCAILDDGTVRCWGYGGDGRLGYGNTDSVGDNETPASARPVNLGAGHTARAISAGGTHTCAVLDDGTVRCWGYGGYGELGYANARNAGDRAATTPDKLGAVNLGAGRTAVAISAGELHTCALLGNATVRCWGYGANGLLGYCSQRNVGETGPPGATGPVNLSPGDGGTGCAASTPPPAKHPPDPLHAQALRASALHGCLASAAHGTKHARARARERCLQRYARTPGRIRRPRARALTATRIELTFIAPGTDGSKPPAARGYLIKQSTRPIRTTRDYRHAHALCHRRCRFNVKAVGTKIKLTITHLRPHTSYHYTIAALDNVTGKPGPRSATIKARTRAIRAHKAVR